METAIDISESRGLGRGLRAGTPNQRARWPESRPAPDRTAPSTARAPKCQLSVAVDIRLPTHLLQSQIPRVTRV